MLSTLLLLLAQLTGLLSGLAFFAFTLIGFLLLILFTWAVVQLFHDDTAIKRKGATGLFAFLLILVLLAGVRGAYNTPQTAGNGKTGILAGGSWFK